MPYSKELHATRFKPILTDPHAFASTLVTVLVDMYGTDAFRWSPRTIVMELEEDCGCKLPPVNVDRLMTGIILLTTNRFYKSLPDFVELCAVLSGAHSTPGIFTPADADDCAWGVTEALLLSPPDERDPEPFVPEIRFYVGQVLKAEGILTPPDILKIAVVDPKVLSRVQADFSDDPVMAEAIWSMEASKTDDINRLVRERLMRLVDQLSKTPLQDGNVEGVAERMLGSLRAMPQGGSPLSG